jgi:hypothetical protein
MNNKSIKKKDNEEKIKKSNLEIDENDLYPENCWIKECLRNNEAFSTNLKSVTIR